MGEVDWPAIARATRERPMYVCLEEPSDPLVWAGELHADGSWYYSRTIRRHCERFHPDMGCGWYRIVESDEP